MLKAWKQMSSINVSVFGLKIIEKMVQLYIPKVEEENETTGPVRP